MSRSHKRSKDSYQGLNVRRLPRSELDDTTMRDLNRYDNRLDHNMKTMDKAKEVVLKSLESDKNIFMRGGIRSNKRYTVQVQNPGDTRQKRDNMTSQTSKYQSDTRNRKSIVQNNQVSTQQPNSTTGNDVTSGAGKLQSKEYDSGNSGGSKKQQQRDILAETRDVIDKQKKGDALLEDYISNHGDIEDKQKQYSSSSPTTADGRTGSYGDVTSLESRTNNSHGFNGGGFKRSTTPTIKVDDYQTATGDFVDYNQVNGKVATSGSQQFPFYDDYSSYGRRSDFWEYLSTPKNPSRNLQKREQLEREFSSPNLKSRATTPAVPKSAKGTRTAAMSGTGPMGTSSLMTPSSLASSTNATSPAKSGQGKKSSSVPGVKTKTKSPIKGK